MPHITIALAGNPNAGKSTIFNALTGARQHVGNWPGKTVEKKSGLFEINHYHIELVDLPGTYSLSAFSLEEEIARNFIIQENPVAVINVVDAGNLERNLYLTTQILETGVPTILVLNMMDMAKRRGAHIDEQKMSEMLGGIPIVTMVARENHGLKQLKAELLKLAAKKFNPRETVSV